MNPEILPQQEPSLNSKFSHSNETESLDRQEVLKTLNWAKETLQSDYGVDNLSTIEGVWLRKLVEQCLLETKTNKTEANRLNDLIQKQIKENGEADPDLLAHVGRLGRLQFEPESEACARWLLELYDINVHDIVYCTLIKDETDGMVYKYPWSSEMDIRDVLAPMSDLEYEAKKNTHEQYDEEREAEINKKINELKAAGHKVSREALAPEPEFKEYLRRLREKATMPEKLD